MGQAKQRGTFEERRNAVIDRTAADREVDINKVKLEPEPFKSVFAILNSIAVEGLSRGQLPEMSAVKAYRQPDGRLYIRAELPSGIKETYVPAEGWSIPASAPPEADLEELGELTRELANSFSRQVEEFQAATEELEARRKAATADGIILGKTEEGLASANKLREIRAILTDLLDDWEKSDDEYFVFVIDREGIELVSDTVPNLNALLTEYLPRMFKTRLSAELYCNFAISGPSPEHRSLIHNTLDELHPFEGAQAKEGRVALRRIRRRHEDQG